MSHLLMITLDIQYFVSFNEKASALNFSKSFTCGPETQTGYKMRTLLSDQGEYLSSKFDNYLSTHGIQRQLTTYTPRQNGVAECKNRTLMNGTRCMLHEALRMRLDEHQVRCNWIICICELYSGTYVHSD